jgi:metal-dependent amidase/aminoacylase/carboxypeptidase family protein
MRKVSSVLCFLVLLGTSLFSQKSDFPELKGPDHQIDKKTESIFPSLVEVRRDIHRNPELSEREQRTSGLIKEYLTKLGLEVEADIGGFGVVGILKGAKPGPVVAWRADMDALADNSPDSAEFKSVTPGVKHACGHDVHVTIGLGVANVLSSVKDRLAGTVLFIFQPAEENFTGAKAMIDAGIFNKLKPDAVFALHIVPLPTGIAAAKPKEMFACRAKITIGLKNISNEKEALNICAGLLEKLKTPGGVDIFSIPLADSETGALNPEGALTNYFVLGGSPKLERQSDSLCTVSARVFASGDSAMASAVGSLKEAINSSPLKDNLLSVEHSYSQPSVFNDPELTAKSLTILQAKYGDNNIVSHYGVIPGFNDDFAFFQKETKGVYFFLGGSNFEKGIVSMPHAPNFAVDEECIKTGVAYFSSLLFELTRR